MITKTITVEIPAGLEVRPRSSGKSVQQQHLRREWKQESKCKEHYGTDDIRTSCR